MQPETVSPEIAQKIKENFYLIQMAIGALFLVLGWIFFRPKEPKSGFRVREADLRRPGAQNPDRSQALAQARLKRSEPLRLPGIRIDGAPHEILGISAQATPEEIQRAYRDLMKRYHPDVVGRPGTREWQEAQKIAEAINQAKAALLKKRR